MNFALLLAAGVFIGLVPSHVSVRDGGSAFLLGIAALICIGAAMACKAFGLS